MASTLTVPKYRTGLVSVLNGIRQARPLNQCCGIKELSLLGNIQQSCMDMGFEPFDFAQSVCEYAYASLGEGAEVSNHKFKAFYGCAGFLFTGTSNNYTNREFLVALGATIIETSANPNTGNHLFIAYLDLETVRTFYHESVKKLENSK